MFVRVSVLEKVPCFEITAFFHSLYMLVEKVVISKQESSSTTLSRSYIVFTLAALSTLCS